MNLEDLRAAQTRERATDGLQDLRDSFYGDVATYLSELKERRDAAAAAADDPFGDPEVQELTDKIETATQVAEAIYERRMGKLVKQASLAAAGMPDEEEGLTDEEQELYDDLVERIEANKSHVLDVISGNTDAASAMGGDAFNSTPNGPEDDLTGTESDAATTADSSGADASAAAAMGAGPSEESEDSTVEPAAPRDGEPADAIAEDLARVKGDDPETVADSTDSDTESSDEGDAVTDGDVERTMIRMTDDVGEIFGVDERSYTLEAEDVVTLPEANAKPLVEKDAAEKLD